MYQVNSVLNSIKLLDTLGSTVIEASFQN